MKCITKVKIQGVWVCQEGVFRLHVVRQFSDNSLEDSGVIRMGYKSITEKLIDLSDTFEKCDLTIKIQDDRV